MASSYATVADYRLRTGDTESADELVAVKLAEQSAKLRGECGITSDLVLTDDAATLATFLVVDAAYKALETTTVDGFGAADGLTQGSFTANGFQQSFTFQNPSGASYWDGATLKAFKRLLGKAQAVGIMAPYYGG